MKVIKTAPLIPSEIKVLEKEGNRVKISLAPFEFGYAVTLAHPIRRLLLLSSVGYAPVGLKIEGVHHEFDSLRGVTEDVSLFIMNLKNIRFIAKALVGQDSSLENQSVVVDYSFKGPMELRARDLSSERIEIVNPEMPLATINEDAQLNFSLIIYKGMGYVPSESTRELMPEGYMPLDGSFTPIKNVVYEIENVLVEGDPNYEKIIFNIETDGQIDPYKAFLSAVKVMSKQLGVFGERPIANTEYSGDYAQRDDAKDLSAKIESMNLSARCFNCLDKIGIKYVGELVLMSEEELKGVKNMGKKSYDEIAEKLSDLGYPVDTELSPEQRESLKKRLEKLEDKGGND
ncbi:DNA-directed RNA polymerase subunit alpha [Helicobacter pylori]|uniref:DNA-directed RNA polymerase subunit alpha n=1 Tax=Helicobacter pylori TaxID=210 RepID=UPI000762C682|nr:DNA-directed RNA polymerase subunit alpha [Helicobacter pylori]OJZ95692.1 DNA-directed RNA polymerase subunit alpha [Helicobacter pylori]OJZ99562.1 DNA-directed RNA polymerase subunit alpha [Helicobacter pylori]